MIQTLSESDVPPTQIAELSGHKACKASKATVTSAQNNRCRCPIYWLTFQVNVQASLPFTSTATPWTPGEFRPDGTSCHYSCPGQQSMALFPDAVIHGGQFSVTINTMNQSPPLPPPSEKHQWKRIRVFSDFDDD